MGGLAVFGNHIITHIKVVVMEKGEEGRFVGIRIWQTGERKGGKKRRSRAVFNRECSMGGHDVYGGGDISGWEGGNARKINRGSGG